ncbi:MAG: hypothetical protein MUF13_00525 [Akkermansiaceae bacterium]|nr:hypothetical protein [Akkermansiaceae bacterium]
MKYHPSPRGSNPRGMSLLELTVVILVLLSLVAVLFIGSRAWKRSGDRAGCVLSQRNIQMATRSYQNLYGYNYGGRPYAENGTQDIARHLYEKGYIERRLFDLATGVTTCPSGGTYSCTTPDIFPLSGQLFIQCSLSDSEGHIPQVYTDW